MAKPEDNEPALPWAVRPLAVGTELEVAIEGGWVAVQVADVHPDHQYTLVVHPAEEYDAAPEQAEADAAAGAADAGQGPADAEGDEVLALRVRIVSDSLLEVLDSDGSEPEGGSERCQWRPAPTSLSQMFSNAFLDIARRQPLPRGVELPSADDMAAMMTQKLAELVRRAVSHTEEAGGKVVDTKSVLAALAGIGAEEGFPGLDAHVQQRMQQQQQQQQGEEEAEDEQPHEKTARTSP